MDKNILRVFAGMKRKKNSGQVLPAMLVGALVFTLCLYFLFESGNIVYRKMRLQAAADAAAMNTARLQALTLNTEGWLNTVQATLFGIRSFAKASFISEPLINSLQRGVSLVQLGLPYYLVSFQGYVQGNAITRSAGADYVLLLSDRNLLLFPTLNVKMTRAFTGTIEKSLDDLKVKVDLKELVKDLEETRYCYWENDSYSGPPVICFNTAEEYKAKRCSGYKEKNVKKDCAGEMRNEEKKYMYKENKDNVITFNEKIIISEGNLEDTEAKREYEDSSEYKNCRENYWDCRNECRETCKEDCSLSKCRRKCKKKYQCKKHFYYERGFQLSDSASDRIDNEIKRLEEIKESADNALRAKIERKLKILEEMSQSSTKFRLVKVKREGNIEGELTPLLAKELRKGMDYIAAGIVEKGVKKVAEKALKILPEVGLDFEVARVENGIEDIPGVIAVAIKKLDFGKFTAADEGIVITAVGRAKISDEIRKNLHLLYPGVIKKENLEFDAVLRAPFFEEMENAKKFFPIVH